MAGLSKSKLMSFLQCPRRLWLEKHRPELAAVDPGQQAAFDTGHAVGELARRLYDPAGSGALVGMEAGMGEALRRTAALLADGGTAPLFEATFQRDGLLARADVLDRAGRRLVEVKSSTSVKEEHLADCAIQAWVLEASPAAPASVAVAHVDNRFTYAGDGDYSRLLVEKDVSEGIAPLRAEVPRWLREAKDVVRGAEPAIAVGRRCSTPHGCPFTGHCWPRVEYPLTALPNVGRHLDALVARGYRDLREIPPDLVPGPDARRVWRAARTGRAELDGAARAELAKLPWPRYYLDFETLGDAIPRWPGTRPYQQVPFQWSLHVQAAAGRLAHEAFLAPGDGLPARAAAEALLAATAEPGPVFTYSDFERRCLGTLGELCPDLAGALDALAARLVDLYPLVKRSWYHPAMQGSWSIKAVLPTIAPELDYAKLDGIQEGTAAQVAFREAIAPGTTAERRKNLEQQLLAYCAHDTLAMLRIVDFLTAT
jgi:hypothetical protein